VPPVRVDQPRRIVVGRFEDRLQERLFAGHIVLLWEYASGSVSQRRPVCKRGFWRAAAGRRFGCFGVRRLAAALDLLDSSADAESSKKSKAVSSHRTPNNQKPRLAAARQMQKTTRPRRITSRQAFLVCETERRSLLPTPSARRVSE
jgi:hypothetical protein